MKAVLQGSAVCLLFTLALAADGLMDSFGPRGFLIAADAVAILSGLLIWISTHLPKRKRKPPVGGGSSNGRRHQRKHWYITPPIMGDEKGFVKHG